MCGGSTVVPPLSSIYKLLLSQCSQQTPYFMRESGRWNWDWNSPQAQVQRSLQLTHVFSSCSKMQEMCYNFLSHWSRTPGKLSKIFLDVSSSIRLEEMSPSQFLFIPLLVCCPKIQRFWEAIPPWIKKTMLRPIQFTPLHYLFHIVPSTMKAYKNSVIPHLNAAKRLIP